MHVGAATIFQNPGKFTTDYDVYREELRLADLAEPLGFESIWGVEHHFTDYTMCPDVLQFLTYMAGRTSDMQLGSMVCVLPWHDPVRVAEQVCMLDNLSDGRFILGMGRGLAKVEYDGFRVDMNESRTRFIESAECLLSGLESGFCEFDGEYIKQPRREIRPNPFRSFKDRAYAAAISPESSRIMAQLGVGMLVIPQKPWDEVEGDLSNYRNAWLESHGAGSAGPPAPVVACWTFCHEDADYARDMARRYIGGYWHTVMDHYQFKADHHKDIKGYEYYGKMAEAMGSVEGVTDFFLNLQVWGTPDRCFERVIEIRSKIGCDAFTGVFSYGGMPYEDSEQSTRLFASEVMPRLQQLGQKAVA
jgi:alkanesulfonate monooxygenase SsuD/methylene tetrahydromethanopterin reductase-like flavin-dependent oxidoreductase (luciferase family)